VKIICNNNNNSNNNMAYNVYVYNNVMANMKICMYVWKANGENENNNGVMCNNNNV
jgi:hypothetical protein